MENRLSRQIIGAVIEVHCVLGGPGLLESVYETALYHELILRGLPCERQQSVSVVYKGVAIRSPLSLDPLVAKKVIVEIKASEKDHPVYEAQLLTYLRLTGVRLGLVLNFGQKYMKDGISRVVNGL